MKMKKYVFALLAAFSLMQSAQAVPAYPYPMKVRQADGTFVTVLLRGDEHSHFSMTTDGYPVMFNEKTNNVEYVKLVSGKMELSGIVASDEGKRDAKTTAFLSSVDKGAMMKIFQEREKSALMRSPMQKSMLSRDFPSTGSPHSLAILVQFSDKKFIDEGTSVKDFYTNMLNQEGFTASNGANGSARDYYISSSNGKFSPTFDVVGPVTLPKASTYYGANSYSGDDYSRLAEFVNKALELADPDVDFSQYDTDGDGLIDNVFFFYAGFGEADSYGQSNTIWPHSFDARYFTQYGYGNYDWTFDGVEMSNYACSNEVAGSNTTQPKGIGTFVHEFGHVLGLPDHYATDYTTSFTPGEWDCMDQGSYNNDQNTPPTFTAYERAELGWLDYTDLDLDAQEVHTLEELQASNKGYRVKVPGKSNEFFVIENRQKTGWDKYIPGHGLLVWHIDQNRSVWNQNTVNNNPSHQYVDIEEADGTKTDGSRGGDAFPGTKGVTEFDFESWAGKSIFSFDGVMENDGLAYFKLGGITHVSLPLPKNLQVVSVGDSSVVFKWEAASNLKYKYRASIAKVNEDGSLTPVPSDLDDKVFSTAQQVTASGLDDATNYNVLVRTAFGQAVSDSVAMAFTTNESPFEKRYPKEAAPKEVSENGFTATWDAVNEADSYVVSLVKHGIGVDMTDKEWGFDNNAMPETWSWNNAAYGPYSGYGKEKPGVKLDDPDGNGSSWIVVNYPESRIGRVKFWCRSYSQDGGTLYIDRWNGTKWDIAASIIPPKDSITKSFDIEATDSVRLRFERKTSNGYVYVDDIVAGCYTTARTPVAGYENLNVGNALSYKFTGLGSAATRSVGDEAVYGFTVRAKKGDVLSAASPETVVTLGGTTNGIGSVDVFDESQPAEMYDLTGRKIDSAAKSNGVYILKQGKKARKYVNSK